MGASVSARPVSLLLKAQQSDPVYSIFLKVFRSNAVLAAAVCAIIHITIWVSVSQVVRANYPLSRPHYLVSPVLYLPRQYINDPSELTFGLFLWGVFIPILWGFYVSSGLMWGKMVLSLVEEKVVGAEFKTILNKPSYPVVTLTVAVAVGLLYMFSTVPSEIALGRVSFWFVDDWSMITITLMVAVNTYIFISFVLKTIILSYRMRQYIGRTGVSKVQIFSADGCGGFGVVGSLAMRISSLAILVGVWAAWYSLLPVFTGGDPNFSISVILLYLAYLVLVPLLLYLIASPVHGAMAEYKRAYKADVARRLEELFSSIDKLDLLRATCEGDTARYLDDYSRLKEVFERIDAMPEWPISLNNFKKFSGLASLPGIIGFVSWVLETADLSRKLLMPGG